MDAVGNSGAQPLPRHLTIAVGLGGLEVWGRRKAPGLPRPRVPGHVREYRKAGPVADSRSDVHLSGGGCASFGLPGVAG